MKILALDLATTTGFAFGQNGKVERYGSVRLKKPSEEQSVAFFNILAYLRDRWTFVADRPDLVVIEAAFHMSSDNGHTNAQATMMKWGLCAVVYAISHEYGIDVQTAHNGTWMKHFTGRGRWGGREVSKQQCIARCKQLGYAPKNADAADAIGIFDYASATWGRHRPDAIVMFNPAIAAVPDERRRVQRTTAGDPFFKE